MAASATIETKRKNPKELARVASAGLIGTTLEFYDHFIYGSAAALVFPKLFFPEDDIFLATILSMVTYGVAFVARPVGGAIFGHYGDKYGRKLVLLWTLLIMGAATVLIGCLPTYHTAGYFAPVALVILRFIQGLALGGEWGGATLMIAEHDPQGRRRGFFGSLVQVASPIGVLTANAVFAGVIWAVSEQAFLSWGWRIPFLLSTVLIVFGFYIRRTISETPVFEGMEGHEEKTPILETLRDYRREVLLAIGSRMGEGVIFYVFALFILIYGPQQLGITKSLALTSVLMGAVVGVFAIPLFGWLSDKIGRVPVIAGGAIGAAIWVFIYFPILATRNPTFIVLAAMVGMFCQAALWAPMASFVPEMFPARVRCTGASLGFQIAGVVGGALSPVIAVWLVGHFNTWLPVAIYSALSLLVVVVSVLIVGETSRVDLRDGEEAEPVARPLRNAAPREQLV
jgi:MFS family permease